MISPLRRSVCISVIYFLKSVETKSHAFLDDLGLQCIQCFSKGRNSSECGRTQYQLIICIAATIKWFMTNRLYHRFEQFLQLVFYFDFTSRSLRFFFFTSFMDLNSVLRCITASFCCGIDMMVKKLSRKACGGIKRGVNITRERPWEF